MKRFYDKVAIQEVPGGWQVMLDARGVKTVGGAPQSVPSRALVDALAEEWAGQGAEIDPRGFLFRDSTDYAIDVAGPKRAETIASLLPYGETDTLCYYAEPHDALFRRQQEVWEPLLAAAETRWDLAFNRVSGILHHPQPAETMERLRMVLEAQDHFTLAALKSLASLSASLVIALSAIAPDADGPTLWDAANLEENWQAELWGKDAEAEALRTRRKSDFLAAMRFVNLLRKG